MFTLANAASSLPSSAQLSPLSSLENLSLPSIPIASQDFKSQLSHCVQSWETLQQREQQLLANLKSCMSNASVPDQLQSIGQEIKEFMDHKNSLLASLLNSSSSSFSASMESINTIPQCEQPKAEKETSNASPVANVALLKMVAQPSEVAFVNKFIIPSPSVSVSETFKPADESSSVVVSAALFYFGADKEVEKSAENKQDILQGVTKVPLEKNGMAVFNKLKVTEMCSKYPNQSFCLVFTLEEYAKGEKRILGSIKSNSFQVQSRPIEKPLPLNVNLNKRKREDEVTNNSPKVSRTWSGVFDCANKRELDGNYIDITDLLTLPQKEAAQRLGISESMLCKRFKECTKRKWPFRYLRKIEKILNTKPEDIITKEDKEKIKKLQKEREECLKPVKIRITSLDRLLSAQQQYQNQPVQSAVSSILNSESQSTSSPLSSPLRGSDSSSSNEDNDEFENEEERCVLESLEMLKSHRFGM